MTNYASPHNANFSAVVAGIPAVLPITLGAVVGVAGFSMFVVLVIFIVKKVRKYKVPPSSSEDREEVIQGFETTYPKRQMFWQRGTHLMPGQQYLHRDAGGPHHMNVVGNTRAIQFNDTVSNFH